MELIADSSMNVSKDAQEQANNVMKLEQSMEKVKGIAYESVKSARKQDAAANSVGAPVNDSKNKMEVLRKLLLVYQIF